MVRKMWKAAVIVVGLMWSMNASGEVRRAVFVDAGITYYSMDWVVGREPLQFGLAEYSFYTDAARRPIMYMDGGRSPKPDDLFFLRTQIYLGPFSYSLPLQRSTVAISFFVFLAGILLLGDWGWKKFRRRRLSENG
jgi:hypothetical protein